MNDWSCGIFNLTWQCLKGHIFKVPYWNSLCISAIAISLHTRFFDRFHDRWLRRRTGFHFGRIDRRFRRLMHSGNRASSYKRFRVFGIDIRYRLIGNSRFFHKSSWITRAGPGKGVDITGIWKESGKPADAKWVHEYGICWAKDFWIA